MRAEAAGKSFCEKVVHKSPNVYLDRPRKGKAIFRSGRSAKNRRRMPQSNRLGRGKMGLSATQYLPVAIEGNTCKGEVVCLRAKGDWKIFAERAQILHTLVARG